MADNLPKPIACLKVRTKSQNLFPHWIIGTDATQIEIISFKVAVVAAFLSERK